MRGGKNGGYVPYSDSIPVLTKSRRHSCDDRVIRGTEAEKNPESPEDQGIPGS